MIAHPSATQDTETAQDLIFDVGMNVCEDPDFYLREGFRVLAVVVNPARSREAEPGT